MSELRISGVSVELLGALVLGDIDLDVPSGSWLTLVGPNGAGKTTLLRAVVGDVEHDGRILLDGRDVGGLRRRARARAIAVVPQQPVHPHGMSVLDYVLLGRTPYVPYFGVETVEDVTVVTDLLATLELTALAGRQVTSLSGGEFQRVVLARSLAQEAPVLLLDEPTSSLDLGHGQQVLELVDRLRRERELTVLAALHDLTTAAQFSDRLAMLVGGRLVAEGTPREVLTRDRVEAQYGARVRVVADPEAGLIVVPVRAASGARSQREGAP